MTTRREFLKTSSLAAAALSVGGCRASASGSGAGVSSPATPAPTLPSAAASGAPGGVQTRERTVLVTGEVIQFLEQ